MDRDERGMNPIAMTIINPWNEYWLSRGSNERLPVPKSCMLLTIKLCLLNPLPDDKF